MDEGSVEMRVVKVIVLSGVSLFFLSGCRVWEVVTPWRTGSESRRDYVYEPLPPEQPAADSPVSEAPPPEEPVQPDPPAEDAPDTEPAPSGGSLSAAAASPPAEAQPTDATASIDQPPVEMAEASAVEGEAPAWPPPLEARFKGDKPKRLGMPVPIFPTDFDWSAVPGGWVEVRVTIGPEGRVIAVEPLEASDRDLVQPTLTALRKARYEPARAPNGVPIQVDFVERVEY